MAVSASLGKLAVEIGGDASGLVREADRAKGVLSGLGKAFAAFRIATGGALAPVAAFGVAWKAAAAAAAVAVTSVGLAMNRLQNQAAVVDSLSQQTGLLARELGVLQQAAEEAGVSGEALARALSSWTESTSSAAFALNQLGISARDANGNIRNMTDVLGQVADKFAGWQDGAAKAEIATKLFGAAGLELIPILNRGADGVKALADRAQLTGKILDDDLIKNSRELSTEWQRLRNTVAALATEWANAFARWIIPVVKDFVKWVADAAEGTRNLVRQVTGLGDTRLDTLAKDLAEVNRLIESLEAKRSNFEEAFRVAPARRALTASIAEATAAIRELEAKRQDIEREMGDLVTRRQPAGAAPPELKTKEESEREKSEAMKKLRAELDQFQADYFGEVPWVRDWSLLLNTVGYEEAMRRLEDVKKKGALTDEQFAKRKADLARQEQQNIYDTASMAAQTLTSLFSKSKGAAIAAAVMNTGVAITRTLAQVPFPYDLIQAGFIAAQGAAQIASIKSATQSGGASAPSVSSGGGGGASSGAPAEAGGSGGGRALHIQGVDPAHIFSGSAVEGLIASINDAVRNGVTLVTTESLRA